MAALSDGHGMIPPVWIDWQLAKAGTVSPLSRAKLLGKQSIPFHIPATLAAHTAGSRIDS
jgi:hypothetical protein